MMYRFQQLTLSIAIILVSFACGRDNSAAVGQKKGSQLLDNQWACTENNCPPINIVLSAQPIENNVLVGIASQPTTWSFTATVPQEAQRNVQMQLYQLPQNAKVSGQGTLQVTVNLLEQQAQQSSVPILAIARDVTRCQVEVGEANASACSDLQNRSLQAFDQTMQWNWVIRNPRPEEAMDPSFAQSAQYAGSNSGLSGCSSGFMQGALPAILQGQILPGIINGTTQCLGNAMNNLNQ